jgi:hypothetical protein
MAHAEGDCRGQLDRSARHDRCARCFLLGFAYVSKHLHATLVVGPPAFRKAYPAGGSIEESGLQVCFELRHLPRGGGSGQVQAFGSLGKASGFNYLREQLHCCEPIHLCLLVLANYPEFRDLKLRKCHFIPEREIFIIADIHFLNRLFLFQGA